VKNKTLCWKLILTIISIGLMNFFFYPKLEVKAITEEAILYDTSRYSLFIYILGFGIALAIVCLVAMFIILRIKTKSEKRVAEAALELKHITNSIHAGFVNFILENNYEIIYASKGYYDIIGYSKEEVQQEFENSVISFVFHEDYDKFKILKNVLINGDYIQKEVRMVTKEGKKIWILINGNYIEDKDGNHTISAVLVDITETKLMHERLLLEEERYRVAAEISNDILFEYDINEDLMKFVDKYRDLYGRNPIIPNFSNHYLQINEMIHPEDIGIFAEYSRALSSGKEMIESEFRICDVKNEYVWCHTRGKTIYDDNKQPTRVIGKIVNIDLHKKELQKLEYKAKRDPLTGVYNKSATKDLIDHYILKNCDAKHIFMIIDIDDFKKINDKYGHLQGDKVLSFVISQVRMIFTAGEIIGRIGGDEFAVFMGDIGNKDAIILKADLLRRALRTVYREEEYEIAVSGSIGISMYPQDGKTYNQLLNCADKALYEVKEHGKDGYKLFT